MLMNRSDTDPGEILRRVQLRHLDSLLAELEGLNMHEAQALPQALSQKLRAAGVGHRPDATVSSVIDLVFRAQEAYLHQLPRKGRSAA